MKYYVLCIKYLKRCAARAREAYTLYLIPYTSYFSVNPRELRSRGFTLMLAALVASLLTALSLAMFSIAKKELVLSSLGRDSQFAFYAADTGAECALLWDFKHRAFSTTTVYSSTTTPARCADQELKDFPTDWGEGIFDDVVGLGGPNQYVSSFWFEPEGYCVYVTVTKQDVNPRTTIESLGYSTPCSAPNHPRRLERAVRTRF